MVRRVREMLRLQTQPGSMAIDTSSLACNRTVQEVSRIELKAWFGRRDLERPSTLRIGQPRGWLQARASAIENPVVIVSAPVLQLHVVHRDARADCRRLAEVERRPLHGREFAGRN